METRRDSISVPRLLPAIRPSPQEGVARPTNTRVIQLLKRPQTVINHSYVDYSLVPYALHENVLPKNTEELDFHQKLHVLLELPESHGIIEWLTHGRAFTIVNPAKLEANLCPRLFGHSRYSKFLNQLGIHGYKELTTDSHRNTYYSQLLLRGLPHLTKYMPPPKRVFRRLRQDPGHEPDFSVINLIAPLPRDPRFGTPLTIDDIIAFCRLSSINEEQVLSKLHFLLMTRGEGLLYHKLMMQKSQQEQKQKNQHGQRKQPPPPPG